MFPLFRSLNRDTGKAHAHPHVWETFRDRGIALHPGELAMWVGPPGCGKSTTALNYIARAGVPTLLVSCDMHRRIVTSRVAAMTTDTPLSTVTGEMGTSEGAAKYAEVLQCIDHLFTAYPSRPNAEALARAQMAFMEIHGVPSPIMVVDNLMNLDHGADNEYTGMRDTCQVLHYMAMELDICVLLLHHVNLGSIDLTVPAPLNYIKGQVSELPSLIVSFSKIGGELRGAAVKNREGRADPTGRDYFTLSYDEETQKITDPVVVPKTPTVWDRQPPAQGPDWASRAYKD